MKHFDLIMFDLDGTLVETAPEIMDAVNDTLGCFDLGLVTQQQVNDWIGHGTLELLIQALAFSSQRPVAEVRASAQLHSMTARYNGFYEQRCGSRSRLYPQVLDTLGALRALGVKLAVVTNKEGRYTRTVMDVHQITQLFDAVVCGDTFATKKPDPAGVRHCLQRFDIRPERERVFIRADLNVPLDDRRSHHRRHPHPRLVPCIRMALDAGAAVMVTSHLGRPTEGEFKPEDSLAPVAKRLSELLGRDVPLVANWVDGVTVAPGQVVLLENCRVNKGEKKNKEELAASWPPCATFLCTTPLAPPTAPRAPPTASPICPHRLRWPVAVGRNRRPDQGPGQPQAPAGRHRGGLQGVHQAHHPAKPGRQGGPADCGRRHCQHLHAGRRPAHRQKPGRTRSAGRGQAVMAAMKARGAEVPIPTDVVTAKTFAADAPATVKAATDVADDDLILDIGPETAAGWRRSSNRLAPSSGTARGRVRVSRL
jgi:phosphoglycerate kinase